MLYIDKTIFDFHFFMPIFAHLHRYSYVLYEERNEEKILQCEVM